MSPEPRRSEPAKAERFFKKAIELDRNRDRFALDCSIGLFGEFLMKEGRHNEWLREQGSNLVCRVKASRR